MLGLSEQVGGHERRIGRGIGKDGQLGWSGHEVDADTPAHLCLGFGDEAVAGADDDVDGGHRPRAERKGGDRLGPAHGKDPVDVGDARRGQDRRMDGAVGARRRGQHEFATARHARRQRAHEHRRAERIPAARHVDADAVDRQQPLFERDARFLQPHGPQRGSLRKGEPDDP